MMSSLNPSSMVRIGNYFFMCLIWLNFLIAVAFLNSICTILVWQLFLKHLMRENLFPRYISNINLYIIYVQFGTKKSEDICLPILQTQIVFFFFFVGSILPFPWKDLAIILKRTLFSRRCAEWWGSHFTEMVIGAVTREQS